MSSAIVLSSGQAIPAPECYAEDLALARACATGDRAAIDAVESRCTLELRATHARMRGEKPPFDEFVQTMRTKLFVGPPPRIAEYRGAGSLKGFVRVVGARVLIEAARRAKPTEPVGEIVSSQNDPEAEYFKRRYAADFSRAFEDAARRLDAESREVLREHYVRRMGIDAIAEAHGVHRATAARRLASARENVLRETRQLLMARLGVPRDELESIVRMLESRMHVTVDRVLA
ncbi:MAG TPA: sigma-70 family RNA polymerase sigma factor [Polyangiaceae bacterium]|jgi:RNA polymerase sigma-70 factor (ECF subfamily)